MSRKQRKPRPQAPKPSPVRYPVVDAVRGWAVLLMIAYHFCYDLVFFRLVYFDFQHHPFWLGARAAIVGLFLAVSGMSVYLAAIHQVPLKRRVLRLLILAGCAGLVTAGSMVLFPQRFIFFGILHFLVVAGILAPFFVRFGAWNLVLGTLIVAAGVLWQHPGFDGSVWQWLGFVTAHPATEDYVPFFPWFGVVLWGIAAGGYRRGFLANPPRPPFFKEGRLPSLEKGGPGGFTKWTTWLGRHSLWIYLLHQPLLLGMLYCVVLAYRFVSL